MMTPIVRDGKFPWSAIAMGLGVLVVTGVSAMGHDDGPAVPSRKHPKWGQFPPRRRVTSQGTLGYGPPGLFPGFQGFGLGYHLGHGYGGDALGVGAEGGYPFLGGPGYPHPSPCLRRSGGITPFPYFGGPGGPWPDQPHFFGDVGPLVPDQPVVTFESESPETGYPGGYGAFTGSLPYPESTFAPFSSRNTGGGSAPIPPSPAPPVGSAPDPADASGSLGLDTESVVDAGLVKGLKGLKVIRVRPGSPAEKAGLQVGDVIRSANGYLTEEPGNLTWILANATPDKILAMNVLAARGGEIRAITARRP